MDIRIVIAVCSTFVIIQVASFDVSRQNGVCDFCPQIKCSSDCSSVMVCYNQKSPSIALKCPRNQPYCSNGICGNRNENCPIKLKDDSETDSFVCTSDGIFPDPTNCTNWYDCSTAEKYSCAAGEIFNSKTNQCVRGTPRIDHASKNICRKISCDKKPNGYILFPANPAFYAYCSDGSMQLFKCHVNGEVFDATANKCIFKCTSAGTFPDPLNCTNYYLCEGLISLRQKKLHCAEGHHFDGMKCVVGTDCGVDPPMNNNTTPTTTPTPTITPTTTPTPTPTITPTITPTTTPSTTPTTTPTTTTTPTDEGTTSIPFKKSAPKDISNDSIKLSSPFNFIWKHNGKFSYRLKKYL